MLFEQAKTLCTLKEAPKGQTVQLWEVISVTCWLDWKVLFVNIYAQRAGEPLTPFPVFKDSMKY